MIRFRHVARNVQLGVFRGFGAHPPFVENWRLENNSSSRRRHDGAPSAQKILYFFGKNNWILGLYFDKN